MTHEEIIEAWFAIDELGGKNVSTELFSFEGASSKRYCARIRFSCYIFSHRNANRYLAMEQAINEYSEFVLTNSK